MSSSVRTSLYEACKSTQSNSTFSNSTLDDALSRQEQIFRCISESNANSIDTSDEVIHFVPCFVTAPHHTYSPCIFSLQAGFAMLCAGSVRKKNVTNTMLKNLLDACGAALGFYSVGYAFAYGGSVDAGKKTFI
eukprot:scaffold536_cov193-Alexandrium_tamarense.AAC.1